MFDSVVVFSRTRLLRTKIFAGVWTLTFVVVVIHIWYNEHILVSTPSTYDDE